MLWAFVVDDWRLRGAGVFDIFATPQEPQGGQADRGQEQRGGGGDDVAVVAMSMSATVVLVLALTLELELALLLRLLIVQRGVEVNDLLTLLFAALALVLLGPAVAVASAAA